jgi:hypothetical protein
VRLSPRLSFFSIQVVFFAGVLSAAGNAQTAYLTSGGAQRAAGAADASSQPASELPLPDAPDALPLSAVPAQPQNSGEPWEGIKRYGPLSRVSIGADVSPLGIGIKSATILTRYLDARMLINFFNYESPNFDIDSIKADARLHLFSIGAAVDAYPRNSIWRLSAGLLLYNGNNLSITGQIEPGQSFTVNGANYYSANANTASGATPFSGSGTLGLDARQPELFLSGGFGRFVPRSERHWSFPSEFGVIFMGAPTINTNVSGWVCQDAAQTNCSNVGDATNPLAIQFNSALQAQEAKWRHSASSFSIYPMFSYSVVYSFDIR